MPATYQAVCWVPSVQAKMKGSPLALDECTTNRGRGREHSPPWRSQAWLAEVVTGDLRGSLLRLCVCGVPITCAIGGLEGPGFATKH